MRSSWFRAKTLVFLVSALLALGAEAQAKDGLRLAGDVLTAALPAASAGKTLLLGDRAGTWQFGKAIALTLGTTYALKYAVDEERPNGGTLSFPSGHSSIAFASAEFLSRRYGWKCGLPAYLAASVVGFSRVESREHYVHDVLAGALIGIGSSYLFTRQYGGWRILAETDAVSWRIGLSHAW